MTNDSWQDNCRTGITSAVGLFRTRFSPRGDKYAACFKNERTLSVFQKAKEGGPFEALDRRARENARQIPNPLCGGHSTKDVRVRKLEPSPDPPCLEAS